MDEAWFGEFSATGRPVPSPGPRYAPVRVDKFVLMSLATFGLYAMVWFYRNWRFVRDDLGESVLPWARTLFAPIFYFSLARRLKVSGAALLALGFLVWNGLWRLPDPWWLVTCLSFVPLLPAVLAINRMNRFAREKPASYGWRKRDGLGVLGVAALGLVWFGAASPPNFVQTADEVRTEDLAYLIVEGILGADEELLFFYSPGLTSIESDGALVSDWGVTAYWTDPVTEELVIGFIAFADIVDVEVNPSSNWFEDTVVRVSDTDGNWLVFVLSAEEGGDQDFLAAIDDRRRQADVKEGSI